ARAAPEGVGPRAPCFWLPLILACRQPLLPRGEKGLDAWRARRFSRTVRILSILPSGGAELRQASHPIASRPREAAHDLGQARTRGARGGADTGCRTCRARGAALPRRARGLSESPGAD